MKQEQHLSTITKALLGSTFSLPAGCEKSTPHRYTHSKENGFTSVRKSTYKGKSIEIHTTYKIIIDGKPVATDAMAMDDGQVHTHALPQYVFTSAIHLVKALIHLSKDKGSVDELSLEITQEGEK